MESSNVAAEATAFLNGAGKAPKFTADQKAWLQVILDHNDTAPIGDRCGLKRAHAELKAKYGFKYGQGALSGMVVAEFGRRSWGVK